MNVNKLLLALSLAISFTSTRVFAQTTWTDGGGDASWTNTSNWSNGVPTSGTAVIFENPISVVGIDTGGSTTVASITVNTGTDAFFIASAGSETLIVNGSFLNNSTNLVEINVGYTVGASSILDGPITFNSSLNLDLRTATIAGDITLNSSIVFQLNNTTITGYGRFSAGSGSSITFSGGINSISFSASSTYTGVNGDSFNLVSNSGGTLTGFSASLFDISTLPTLTGGLTWNTDNLGSGVLSVVPEPATWALLATGLTTMMIFRPRRRRD